MKTLEVWRGSFREDHRKSILITQTSSQHCWMPEVRIAVIFSKSAVQTPCSEEAMKQLFSCAEGVCQSDGKTCAGILNWISGKRPRKSWFAPPALAAQGNSICSVSRRDKCSTCFSYAATVYQTGGHIHQTLTTRDGSDSIRAERRIYQLLKASVESGLR